MLMLSSKARGDSPDPRARHAGSPGPAATLASHDIARARIDPVARAYFRLRVGDAVGELRQRRRVPPTARNERRATGLTLPGVRRARARRRQHTRSLVGASRRARALLRSAHLAAIRRR